MSKQILEMETVRLGGLYDKETKKHQMGSVWDKNALSPTIDTMQGGLREPMIIEETKVKDNFVLENVVIGGMQAHQSIKKDGVCTCLTSSMGTGGGYVPMIPEKVGIKQATKKGYIECEVGGVADFSFPDSKLRRGRVQEGGKICPTLMAGGNGVCKIERDERFFRQALETLENGECEIGDTIDAFNGKVNKSGVSPTITTRPEGFKTAILPVVENSCIQTQYRIRKLTPKECWRLMGFYDEDFEKAEKVNSNTQLYKQAGNSIVVDVLEAIFRNLF